MEKSGIRGSYDRRIIGTTGEYLVSSLLNKRGYVAQRFDTEAFDVIVHETDEVKNEVFKVGKPPFYLQVVTMDKKGEEPHHLSKKKVESIKNMAKKIKIDLEQVYFVYGVFTDDIRSVKFFFIPIIKLDEMGLLSRKGESYILTRKRLENQKFVTSL